MVYGLLINSNQLSFIVRPSALRDEDPLWYDHAEPEEVAGPFLVTCAFVFVVLGQIWSMPDRLWTVIVRPGRARA